MGEAPASTMATDPTVAGHRVLSVLRWEPGRTTFHAVAPDGLTVILHVLAPSTERKTGERFLARAQRLRELSHPGLPVVLSAGVSDEGPWIATVETEGVGLDVLIDDGINTLRTVRVLGEMAEALDAAHAAGLAHGDLRPANVAVPERPVERPVLVDFDLLGASAGAPVTEEGAPYAAPERFRGDPPSAAADRYALACILGECVAGVPPYGRARAAARRGHLDGRIPTLSSAGPTVPAALDGVLARGLAKDPAGRPSTAAELIADAARALLQQPRAPSVPASIGAAARPPVTRAATPPAAAEPARARRSGPTLALAALAAAAVLVAGGAGYTLGGASDDGPGSPAKATGGIVDVGVPPGWSRSADAGATNRPALEAGVRLAAREGAGGSIVAGVAKDAAAVVDPTRLARELTARPARPDVVRLGAATALRWRNLRGRGGSRTTLYVVTTSAGAAGIACTGVAGGACDAAAAGLRMRAGRVYDPVAGITWKNRLGITIRRLRARQAARLRRLRLAGTPRAQGRRVASLAGAHRSAARGLRSARTPPQAVEARGRVLAGLRAIERAYAGLGRAAARRRGGDYARARARLRGADAQLRRTLRGI